MQLIQQLQHLALQGEPQAAAALASLNSDMAVVSSPPQSFSHQQQQQQHQAQQRQRNQQVKFHFDLNRVLSQTDFYFKTSTDMGMHFNEFSLSQLV